MPTRARVFVMIVLSGCTAPSAVPADAPRIVAFDVQANPNNVISAIVSYQVTGAVRAHVEFEGGPEGAQSGPDLPVTNDPGQIPVLALYPETDYLLRLATTSAAGAIVHSQSLPFRTGKLPDSIAPFEVTTNGTPEPGLTLLAVSRTDPSLPPHPAVIVDATGRVVWYREVAGTVGDFQLQPNGHFTAATAVTSQVPYYAGTYFEWDVLGNAVASWTAQGYPFTDSHEIRLLDDGADALLYGFEARTLDLSALGGPADATVVGDVFQRLGRDGSVQFQWHAFDHLSPANADDFVWQTPGPAGYDFTHANAIEVDADGNYLLSIRHLSVIVKVDAHSGEVLWQMGAGKGNQFQFIDDPHNGFTMMHAIRRLPNGHFLFIDNGNLHTPPSSRAVEYEVDEQAKTARLVWSFEPGVVSCCMGFAQRLPGGNTLVDLGQDYRVDEVAADGSIVWELRLPNAGTGFFGIYRASRIPSLPLGN